MLCVVLLCGVVACDRAHRQFHLCMPLAALSCRCCLLYCGCAVWSSKTPAHRVRRVCGKLCMPGLLLLQESKMGRALISKTKLLADENQEMAAQLREGTAAAQVRRSTSGRTIGHSVQVMPLRPIWQALLPPAALVLMAWQRLCLPAYESKSHIDPSFYIISSELLRPFWPALLPPAALLVWQGRMLADFNWPAHERQRALLARRSIRATRTRRPSRQQACCIRSCVLHCTTLTSLVSLES